MRVLLILIVTMLFFSSCSLFKTETIPSPVPTEQALSRSTETSEESLLATEQAMAGIVKTRAALTLTAQPSFTPWTTFTPIPANLATLTPIPNRTPIANGAYFDVPADVLGAKYDIENAYYFDELETGERYEFYAGAMAGSGSKETAQGVMVLRVLQFSDTENKAKVIASQEYLTPIQAGPLQLEVDITGSILLFTPMHFEWGFFVRQREMIDLGNPPLARLETGTETQLAGRGSFCWKGTCADGPVIPTPSLPLAIRSSQFTHLHLPLDQPPDGLTLSAMLVSLPGLLQGDPSYDYIGEDSASWSYERPGRESLDLGTFPLRREQDIKFSLKPGYYALTVLAVWHDYGDVRYGFLVEVQE